MVKLEFKLRVHSLNYFNYHTLPLLLKASRILQMFAYFIFFLQGATDHANQCIRTTVYIRAFPKWRPLPPNSLSLHHLKLCTKHLPILALTCSSVYVTRGSSPSRSQCALMLTVLRQLVLPELTSCCCHPELRGRKWLWLRT